MLFIVSLLVLSIIGDNSIQKQTDNQLLSLTTITIYVTYVFQVYTVGEEYAHAEARKSPALDGKVERDAQGKEIRYPVILNANEKLIAKQVCSIFKVCFVD